MPWLSAEDCRMWSAGRHVNSYRKLGAHPEPGGTWFAVWAPHADEISVIGDFNDWQAGQYPLERFGDCGLWQTFVPGVGVGHHYKFHIRRGDYLADKTDPYAYRMEPPAPGGHPLAGLSAIVQDLEYDWNDDAWMANRKGPAGLKQPMAVYEVHLGSWRKKKDGHSLDYRTIAEPLADYVSDLGFTHVELLPVAEHPYYPSWGYQVVGYYATTYRYGSPADLMYLINHLHERGIGVILDWVPAHFAADAQSLVFYDGSTLFEYGDAQMRHHPDWGTYVFDYGKPGVRNFLISNALFWLDRFHVDGLRVDAVASMLYRDYSRDHWTPNMYGGRENLEAIDFLKKTNEVVYCQFPEAITIAEESTAWPKVTLPTSYDGLGFLYKWNMGWMHDTLTYMRYDPIHRRFHHDGLTFPLVYAFSENYVLPLSHDEVVHGKGSLWNKMPGDDWQRYANLRLLYGHLVGHPGKLVLFMGGELAQHREWDCNSELSWSLLKDPRHAGIKLWLTDLIRLYRSRQALWDDGPDGFHWVDYSDHDHSVISYIRSYEGDELLFAFNFTPVPRGEYVMPLKGKGEWEILLNSDAESYGGSGFAVRPPSRAKNGGLVADLPPLGVLVLGRRKK